MDKFYKGYSGKSQGYYSRVVVQMYDKPKPSLFDDYPIIAQVTFLLDGSKKFFCSKEELENVVDIQRQITKEEHDYLETLARLSTELFMNQYTGGFPRESTCKNYAHHLYTDLKKVIDKQERIE